MSKVSKQVRPVLTISDLNMSGECTCGDGMRYSAAYPTGADVDLCYGVCPIVSEIVMGGK